nr:tripartite motif-containing protein 10-like [Pelodiscus sinensis]|eukprot:XP_006110457.2 tripartite motif-containing protein 10-like [Pelodiscus sinensis]
MAAAKAGHTLLSELTCSVCLDSFKDPVCLDCGHNFCQACLTQWWQGLSTNFSCPECRETFSQRNFKLNRQLRNIVEASRPLTMEPKQEPEVETICEKHNEALKIYCQKDQIPICLVCHLSRDHRDHTVVLIEEAAETYKDRMQSSLKILKKERDRIQSFKLSGEKKSQELLKQLETEKQKIVSEFEQLSKFLKGQERLLLAQLEKLKKEIEKRRDEYVAKLHEELSSFSSLISEMEQKYQQPAIEFMQDITGTLRRCAREKFYTPAFSSDLKWESSKKAESLEDIMKKLKDTLASRLPFLKDHKDYTVVPIDEAALDSKVHIQHHLETLKQKRKEVLRLRSNGEKKSQELLRKTHLERQTIVFQFRQLCQFLKEQERFQLAQLDETEQDIVKKWDQYSAKLHDEISSLSTLIYELQQKCRQPASELLQPGRVLQRQATCDGKEKHPAFSVSAPCPPHFGSVSAANVTLDPATAHPELIVSADGKSVRRGETWQDLPDTPERCDTELCVLGCEGFSAGRHCWEVEAVGLCAVGVARESVSRKRRVRVKHKQEIWAVEWSGDQWFPAFTSSVVSLFLIKTPRRLRVYLDFESGKVTFIDAAKGELIATSAFSVAGERI